MCCAGSNFFFFLFRTHANACVKGDKTRKRSQSIGRDGEEKKELETQFKITRYYTIIKHAHFFYARVGGGYACKCLHALLSFALLARVLFKTKISSSPPVLLRLLLLRARVVVRRGYESTRRNEPHFFPPKLV